MSALVSRLQPADLTKESPKGYTPAQAHLVCRLFPSHVALERRSTCRWRRRVVMCEHAERIGRQRISCNLSATGEIVIVILYGKAPIATLIDMAVSGCLVVGVVALGVCQS